MKFLITGASGFVGSQIIELLSKQGHQVHGLTRKASAQKATEQVRWFDWNPTEELPPQLAFDGVEAVINLVGENISNKRWSEDQKQRILNSRVKSTKNLILGINQFGENVSTLVSSSAVGIYTANLGDTEINEDGAKAKNFLSEVCTQWENATEGLNEKVRKVILRIGVVLGAKGGAVARLAPIFKLGAGGPIGNGAAWMPWIHVEDLARLFIEAGLNEKFTGIYNAVSPRPVRNSEFTKAMAKSLHRPAIFPVPPFMLKLAFGEMSSIILDSQKVTSKRMSDTEFIFRFADIQAAMDKEFQK